MTDLSPIIAGGGILVGWIVNIVVQTTRLAVRLQRIDDAIEAQTEQLTRLAAHVERQNGRIARLEVELAELRAKRQ